MIMKKIHSITKIINDDRIIIELKAFDEKGKELFSYKNLSGIATSCEAMRLNKLLLRKNSAFKLHSSSLTKNQIFIRT